MKSYSNNPLSDVITKAKRDKEKRLKTVTAEKQAGILDGLSFLDMAHEREIVRQAKELGEQILSFIDIVKCYINTNTMFHSPPIELEKDYSDRESKLFNLYRKYKKEIKKRPDLLNIPDIRKDCEKIEIIMSNFR